ncbi:hypothetical protein GGR57DRAFT_454965 [Xylariaceae sp. FL1272]|nr:hypothetical protein GGR57DRAFT_454965 [Xylariaceae sp. FL1272]
MSDPAVSSSPAAPRPLPAFGPEEPGDGSTVSLQPDTKEMPASTSSIPDEMPPSHEASLASIASSPSHAASASSSKAGTMTTESPPNNRSPPIPSSIPSTSSGAAPPHSISMSVSASASGSQAGTGTMTATSPPSTASAGGMPPNRPTDLNPTLPTRSSQLHIAEARAALVASMSNMLDTELQSRASLLHSNAAALSRQERDVIKATEALRKENDKLAKVAQDAGRKIKELGNVQNWAEVVERDFLVLEETVRLVKRGSDDGSSMGCSDPDCDGCCWGGSESGSEDRSRRGSVSEGESEAVRNKDQVSRKTDTNGHTESMQTIAGYGDVKGKGVELSDGPDKASISTTTGGVNVSLDEAILESLMEALETDIRIGADDGIPKASAVDATSRENAVTTS